MRSERRKSPRKSVTKRSLSSMFSSPKASNSFLATSARDRNVPVRFGKWSAAEDAYLHKLLQLFRDGILVGVDAKTSLRSWLAQMLNCCPMRISKKQMHGRGFKGKSKYKRNVLKVDKLSQQQYEQLCNDVWKLRADFLRKWADEEVERRDSIISKSDESFQMWYDKVLELVPTPKIARPAGVKEIREKRRVELLTELVEEDTKRLKVSDLMLVEQEPDQEIQTQEIALVALEPVPIPDSASSYDAIVTPLPLAYCSDNGSVESWLSSSCRGNTGQWNELPSVSQHVNVNEARYTICEDQVQFSFKVDNQQAGLSMTRRSSRVVIDFGAPSGWHSEEPKCSPFLDYSEWTDNDLTEELAMLVEPGTFDWDDTPHVTYSPTLNFL